MAERSVGLSQMTDAARAADLRRMKLVATGLFVLAAIVFIVAKILEQDQQNWGYVRATAEAAMVGALADWFAVTALFKHPLGIPIPHTAIIKKRKDQIGSSLGGFVEENFLTRQVVSERLADAGIAARLGTWLSEPANARTVGDQSAMVVRGVTEVLQDDVVQSGLDAVITERAKQVKVAPLVGRVIDVAIEGEHHQTLLDAVLSALDGFMDDNIDSFRNRLTQESPWWVPETVDDVVFDKIYSAVRRFLTEVDQDSHHEIRRELDQRSLKLAQDLRTSPALIERGEEMKAEFLAHPEVRAWSNNLWLKMKAGLIEATEDPQSQLRLSLEDALVDAGVKLSADPELQRKVDEWITGAVGYVAEQFRGEVAELIATTVQRWDTEETAERIELQVGRDLQFIRINGTLVGGLAGFLIYTISEVLIS
jgi:uncharacterized membrane-anchored protein YjiN (DUF445 family)